MVGPEFLNLIIHSCNSFLHLYLDKAELILFNKLEAKFSRVLISLSIFESQIVGEGFQNTSLEQLGSLSLFIKEI